MEDQQDSPPKEKRSRDDANLDASYKRSMTEAGYMELDQHIGGDCHQAPIEQQQQEPNAQTDLSPTKHLTVESIASHVAGHLRAIMLLTLRVISIDVAIDVSEDSQSVPGGPSLKQAACRREKTRWCIYYRYGP